MTANKSAAHTFVKQGVYYFVRRVPLELRRHYTSPRISYSLRTRSLSVAASRASRAAENLDEYWYHLRMQDAELPGQHMLRLARTSALAPMSTAGQVAHSGSLKLSEAVSVYLRLKGVGKGITFHRAAERSCGYVLDVCGDKVLTDYTKADANAFRGYLKRHAKVCWAAWYVGLDFLNARPRQISANSGFFADTHLRFLFSSPFSALKRQGTETLN